MLDALSGLRVLQAKRVRYQQIQLIDLVQIVLTANIKQTPVTLETKRAKCDLCSIVEHFVSNNWQVVDS